jgi:hypothetical protein
VRLSKHGHARCREHDPPGTDRHFSHTAPPPSPCALFFRHPFSDIRHLASFNIASFPQNDTPEDKLAIQSVLPGIMMYTLSEFDGRMKTADWANLPKAPAPPASEEETEWVLPDEFVRTEGPSLPRPPLPSPGLIIISLQYKRFPEKTSAVSSECGHVRYR